MAFLTVQKEKTLLHLAAKDGCTGTVELLLSTGAFINAVDEVRHYFESWTQHSNMYPLQRSTTLSMQLHQYFYAVFEHFCHSKIQIFAVGFDIQKFMERNMQMSHLPCCPQHQHSLASHALTINQPLFYYHSKSFITHFVGSLPAYLVDRRMDPVLYNSFSAFLIPAWTHCL